MSSKVFIQHSIAEKTESIPLEVSKKRTYDMSNIISQIERLFLRPSLKRKGTKRTWLTKVLEASFLIRLVDMQQTPIQDLE